MANIEIKKRCIMIEINFYKIAIVSILLLIFGFLLSLTCHCNSKSNPEPVYINLDLNLINLDGSITKLFLQDTVYADDNRIYYNPDPVKVNFDSANIVYTPGPVVTVHDTIPHDIQNGMLITWDYQAAEPVTFKIYLFGRDTTITYDPPLYYIPPDSQRFEYSIFNIPLIIGNYQDSTYYWQTTYGQVTAVDSAGNESIPSPPFWAWRKKEK
jgi:hypothetical protein